MGDMLNEQKYIKQRVKITNLLISDENPRFDPVSSQKEAISVMLKDQGDKLYNLAKDIVEAGLNPVDPILVIPDKNEKNRYIVREGNRRITALKLLLQPDLVPTDMKSLSSKFKLLNNSTKDLSTFSEIDCVISLNTNDANRWIMLKHNGENDGIGTVVWKREQKDRFLQNLGYQKSIVLQLLDYLYENIELGKKIKEKIYGIELTNMERIISDRDFKKFLGINVIKNKLSIEDNQSSNIDRIKIVIRDLAEKRIVVGDIYNKEKRALYMDRIATELAPPLNSNRSSDSEQLQSKANNTQTKANDSFDKVTTALDFKDGINQSTNNNSSASKITINNNLQTKPNVKDKSLSTKRKMLVNCSLSIEHHRMNKIYKELKEIDVDQYANAVAVLFRVFIELSLDNYFTRKNVIPGLAINKELHVKLEGVANYMQNNGILSEKELKPVRALVSRPNDFASLNTFNAYVHNIDFNPLPDNLKITWDNIELFVKKLWE